MKSNNKPSVTKIMLVTLLIVAILSALSVCYIFVEKKFFLFAYPIKYQELVEKYSSEYELDRLFVYSIIRTESRFDKDAESAVGARGLMQFTESTYEWVRWRLDDSSKTFNDMYLPEKSIQYGCYLLNYLFNRYDSIKEVICAYHAGINQLDKWLDDKTISKNGINLDLIPYQDTENYYYSVTETYEKYKNLYTNSKWKDWT